MQNKKTYTDFIISELNKGNVKYNDVCLLFCTKFDLTKQSFNKYWKIANTEHTEQREAINNAKLEESISLEKEAVKRNILSKHDALEILSEIAQGKVKKVEGTLIIPSPSDRKGAIESIAKIEGWNAPNKLDISTENPIPIFNQNPLNE
jgi:hypothetical protein